MSQYTKTVIGEVLQEQHLLAALVLIVVSYIYKTTCEGLSKGITWVMRQEKEGLIKNWTSGGSKLECITNITAKTRHHIPVCSSPDAHETHSPVTPTCLNFAEQYLLDHVL